MDYFEKTSYLAIIQKKIAENTHLRGYQSQLANAAKCQTSYFSSVLKGKSHLNLDQAAGLVQFWDLNRLYADYFLALVSYERATSTYLKNKFLRELDELRKESQMAYRRLEVGDENRVLLQEGDAAFYLTSWFPAAIHAILKLPGKWTVERIAESLQLSRDLVSEILVRLESLELVARNKECWEFKRFALSRSLDLLTRKSNFMSMRALAGHRDLNTIPSDFHAYAFITLSHEDVGRFRSHWEQALAEGLKLCRDSKSEELHAICMDFFRVC